MRGTFAGWNDQVTIGSARVLAGAWEHTPDFDIPLTVKDDDVYAIDKYGRVWEWNTWWNSDARVREVSQPVLVTDQAEYTQIEAGEDHLVALDSEGQAWAWGGNDYGQLGDGTTEKRDKPVKVTGGHKFSTISTGGAHSVALDSEGNAWAWGANSHGHLGDGTTENRNTPVKVTGGHKFVSVTAFGANTVAQDSTGDVWAWGYNPKNVLAGSDGDKLTSPVKIASGLPLFTKITSTGVSSDGDYSWVFVYALDRQGGLWLWQSCKKCDWNGCKNCDGQDYYRFRRVHEDVKWADITVVQSQIYAKDKTGQVWHWTTDKPEEKWVFAGGFKFGVVRASAYSGWVADTRTNGDILLWDWNQKPGSFGGYPVAYTPVKTAKPAGRITQIATLGKAFLALDEKGQIWVWGVTIPRNPARYGAQVVSTPFLLPVGGGYTQVSGTVTSGGSSYYQESGGEVWGLHKTGVIRAWDETGGLVREYTPEPGTKYVRMVGLGSDNCTFTGTSHRYFREFMVLDDQNQLWTRKAEYGKPEKMVRIHEKHKFKKVFHQCGTTYGVDMNGKTWSWGSDWAGKLGVGDYVQSRPYPTMIHDQSEFTQVVSGEEYAFALDTLGQAWAWGYFYQVNTTVNGSKQENKPVKVEGMPRLVSLTSGRDNMFGLDKNGQLYAWGSNYFGKLGTGDAESKNEPTLIPGQVFVAVEANHEATIGLDRQGQVWVWGNNKNQPLGVGHSETDRVLSPERVVFMGGDKATSVAATPGGTYVVDGFGDMWGVGEGRAMRIVPRKRLSSSNWYARVIAGGWGAFLGMQNGHMRLSNNFEDEGNWRFTKDWGPDVWESVVGGSFMLGQDGRVLTIWGNNRYRQLQTYSKDYYSEPYPYSSRGYGYVVFAGENTSASLEPPSRWLTMAGLNNRGQLGNGKKHDGGSPGESVKHPEEDGKWVTVGLGGSHSLAIDNQGGLYAWGGNDQGQLGTGDTEERLSPTKIPHPEGGKFTQVYAGKDYTLAVDEKRQVWVWGDNQYGQLGLGDTVNRVSPTKLTIPGVQLRLFGVGYYHVVAADMEGDVWVWGRGNRGQLGQGNEQNSTRPVRLKLQNPVEWIRMGKPVLVE